MSTGDVNMQAAQHLLHCHTPVSTRDVPLAASAAQYCVAALWGHCTACDRVRAVCVAAQVGWAMRRRCTSSPPGVCVAA